MGRRRETRVERTMSQTLFDLPSPTGPLAHVDFTPTRKAGLARLEAFLPQAGYAYARNRNTDRGPSDRSNVSALSPWIRRRVVTEEETLRAVLASHRFAAAEKFIQEVVWRTYWKGWLEHRPSVYARYEGELAGLTDRLGIDADLRERWVRACEGRTGLECFDAWARELQELGYLHNHARMWFASIWIFTLKLPWALGADHFHRHLIDADPASNTLSWRWVAGLHTRGKHYLARAANIKEHTLGRFDPRGLLEEGAEALTEAYPLPAPSPPPPGERLSQRRIALLLHEEDLSPEGWSLQADVVGICAPGGWIEGPADRPAARFSRGALEDALTRSSAGFGVAAEAPDDDDAVVGWALGLGVTEVATAWAPVGPLASRLGALSARLAERGVRLVRLRRAFDDRAWPHATAGFFRLRERIPGLLAALGEDGAQIDLK